MKKKHIYGLMIVLACIAGCTSGLYVKTSYGYVGLFDLACYFVAPYLFIRNFSSFTKKAHLVLIAIIVWIFGGVIANWLNYYHSQVLFKAVGVIFSLWCMLVVWLVMLESFPANFISIIIGFAVGGVLGLYILPNGALLSFAEAAGYQGTGYMGEYLIEKQVVPAWIRLYVVLGGALALLIWKKLPGWITPTIFIGAGVAVLLEGGARSNFGIISIAGLVAMGVNYSLKITRLLFKNIISLMIIAILGIKLLVGGYSFLASSGALGEAELSKYEDQFSAGQGLADNINIRGGFSETIQGLAKKPFGHGGTRAARHAAVADGLHKEGVFSIPFWALFVWFIIRFVQNHLYAFNKWAPFVVLYVASALWSVVASPFSMRGAYCFVIAIALLSDKKNFLDEISRL